jgi:hypothetical protein
VYIDIGGSSDRRPSPWGGVLFVLFEFFEFFVLFVVLRVWPGVRIS